jgi:hypothetical protein
LSKPEKQRIGAPLSAEINRAIATYEKEGIAFREKVIGRLVQCGALYLTMAKQVGDPAMKSNINDIGEISFDLSSLISEGVPLSRFKEITDPAAQSIKDRFAAPRTPESEREMNALVKNCKAFHRPNDVAEAVTELLPPLPPLPTLPPPRKENVTPIEFANELQECSLYYTLLAGGTLLQVPQNSGPLSPADQDKAVKSQVYMTKAEQIEVLYKRFDLPPKKWTGLSCF